MNESFRVVFSGEVVDGHDRRDIVEKFARYFQLSEEQTKLYLSKPEKCVLRKGLSEDDAKTCRSQLHELGLVTMIEAEPAAETEPSSDNPYQAPRAGLFDAKNQEILQPVGDFGNLTGPHSVPVSHVMAWFFGGFQYFKKNPVSWIATIFMLALSMTLLMLVPFLNTVVILTIMLIYPVLLGGFAIGCRDVEKGQDFYLDYVTSGFQARWGHMILAGLFYIFGSSIANIIATLLIEYGPGFGDNPGELLVQLSIIGSLISLPMTMAFVFTPALIALENKTFIEAIKLSFIGCVQNPIPLVLFGLVLALGLFLASLPYMLGNLVFLPIAICSTYVAYRDIFYKQSALPRPTQE